MKSQIKGFISGALVSALVLGGAVSALAVSSNVSFNLSAIKFNGEVISEVGEGYALSNGCVAPASITYTDEKGGGTTYLPARRVSELLGVDIGWDSASGAVTIGDAAPATPDTTANTPDYSDWSAEDEAAYQEFKGMWKIFPSDIGKEYTHYSYTGALTEPELKAHLASIGKETIMVYGERWIREYAKENNTSLYIDIYLYYDDSMKGSHNPDDWVNPIIIELSYIKDHWSTVNLNLD